MSTAESTRRILLAFALLSLLGAPLRADPWGLAVVGDDPNVGGSVREILTGFEKTWKPRLLQVEDSPPNWRMLDENSWKVRMEAVVHLVRLGSTANSALVEALENGTPAVRELAVQVLAIRADPDTRPALVRALEDANGTVRMYAVRGLGRMGGHELTEKQQQSLPVHGFGGRFVQASLSQEDMPASDAIKHSLADFDLALMDSAQLGTLAPDFTLTDMVGETYRLSQFRGKKTVVLDFAAADT